MTLSRYEQSRRLLESREDLQELVLRIGSPQPVENVSSPTAILDVVEPFLIGSDSEKFVAVALDNNWRLIDVEVLNIGTVRSTVVDPAQILRWTLTRKRAVSYLAVAHNHPSGRAEPSRRDIEFTKTLVEACLVVGVPLVDHLIVSDDGWSSLACDGEIPESVAGAFYLQESE